jgi:hypothetical protein
MPAGQIQPVDGSVTCSAATTTGSKPAETEVIPPGVPMVGVVGLTPLIETVKPAGDTVDGGPRSLMAAIVPPTPPPLVHGPPEML